MLPTLLLSLVRARVTTAITIKLTDTKQNAKRNSKLILFIQEYLKIGSSHSFINYNLFSYFCSRNGISRRY